MPEKTEKELKIEKMEKELAELKGEKKKEEVKQEEPEEDPLGVGFGLPDSDDYNERMEKAFSG